MSDNLLPAKESRSTCINPRTTSHQRRTSVQLSNIHLNSHSDKSSHPSHARPLLSPQASVSEPVPLSFNPPSSKQRSTYGGSLRHLYHQWMGSLYGFLDPAGPLLPHNKHGAAFGGTQKRSLASGLLRSRWLRFLVLLYCIFSVFLSINHGWHWLRSGPTLDPRFGKQWVAQRTYDQGRFQATTPMSSALT
ncbi:hypothetical protein BDF14DRAFT_752917 [Spinellus fusiger]|nr:hypothetical protein BDF14DRAFT_752917 [Spinellus fusiger]